MSDFEKELGYSLPDGIEDVKAEQTEYYRHPAGIYKGVFGKLEPRYKNLDGKRCEPEEPGAYLSHFIAKILLLSYHKDKEVKKILSYHKSGTHMEKKPDMFIAPLGVKPVELYFPLTISYSPKEQWRNIKLFEKFIVNNVKIVEVGNKQTEKVIKFKNFPFFYGYGVDLVIAESKKGSTYAESLTLNGEIYNKLAVSEMENKIDEMIKEEINRNKNAENPILPPSADDIINDDFLGDYQ